MGGLRQGLGHSDSVATADGKMEALTTEGCGRGPLPPACDLSASLPEAQTSESTSFPHTSTDDSPRRKTGATVTSGSLWKMLGLAWCWKWRKFHQWAEKPYRGQGGALRAGARCLTAWVDPAGHPQLSPTAAHHPPPPSPSAVPSQTAGPGGSTGTSGRRRYGPGHAADTNTEPGRGAGSGAGGKGPQGALPAQKTRPPLMLHLKTLWANFLF